MLTGEAIYDNVVSALRGGAADFLSKPVNLEELFSALKRLSGDSIEFQQAETTEPPQVLIMGDRLEVIHSLQAVFGTRDVNLTSILFPEEWDYVRDEVFDMALLSLAPELLEPALKNLRAHDQSAAMLILVEMPEISRPEQLAGLLPQYRAMPCSSAEMARLAESRFATSTRYETAAHLL